MTEKTEAELQIEVLQAQKVLLEKQYNLRSAQIDARIAKLQNVQE
jgi:hypothetical protein